MTGVTHYFNLAVQKTRENAGAIAVVATTALASASVTTFVLRNMHTAGAASHAESEATFTTQSELLTTALATGNWSYVTAALEIANEMVEHCINGQQSEIQIASEYNTAGIALSVLAAACVVAAYAGYKYAAPQPGYQQVSPTIQ